MQNVPFALVGANRDVLRLTSSLREFLYLFNKLPTYFSSSFAHTGQ
jgi:hypothetical protein